MCLHTRQPPAWLDLTHGVLGGWSTLPLHNPSSPCMCGSIKPRLLESDPSSSPFTSSKTLQWFPSNSWKRCSRFHCIPLLLSYASLDTTAHLIAVQTSWWLISGAMIGHLHPCIVFNCLPFFSYRHTCLFIFSLFKSSDAPTLNVWPI